MHLALASAVFALSGAAALAFEALWFHQAGLALGNSVMASSLVLAAFMAGLALGNAIAARHGDRLAHPLRIFAAAEVSIGVCGALLVFALPGLGPALAPWLEPLLEGGTALVLGRFAVAFALLAVPSTAMGLTLPLLTRALSADPPTYGPVLGRLYGWNTLGAVAGVALAEGFAVAALGIRGTALLAAAGNLLAAGAALALAAHLPPAPRPSGRAGAEAPASALRAHGGAGAWLTAAALAGFALLALEVVAFRFLSLFVVTRAEAFAWMLCVALAGIGLGGLLGGASLRRRPAAPRASGALALAGGAVLLASYAAFPATTRVLVGDAAPSTKLTGASQVLGLAVPLLLPVCVISGVLFTWLGAGLRAVTAATARSTGRLAVANTLGSAAGPLVAAFLLLPALGMEASLLLLAALYAGVGVFLAAVAGGRRAAVAAGAACAGAAALFPFGAMQEQHFRRALSAYGVPRDARLHFREGVNETLLWVEIPFLGAPYVHRLVTDSFSMSATDVQARRYMTLYVVLPAALHPGIRSALLVSYGVGTTARALADTPGVEHIDVVDVSRDIVEMSDLAHPDPARHPLRDPRVALHVEDGRYFLATRERRYDLVTGEPPPPMIAGVVNLYTREYFELVRSRLAEGGFFTTWLPLRQLSDAAALSIVRAFCDAFPDCSLWRGMSFELMLMGTRNAEGPVAASHFRARWRDPRLREELAALGLERPEQLGALFIADADDLARWIRDVPPLVDDRPRRITAPPRSREAMYRLYTEWLDPEAARARFAGSTWIDRLWPPEERSAPLPFFSLQHLIDSFGEDIRSDRWSERLTDLRAVLTSSAARTPVLWLLGSDADAQRIIDAADPEARGAPEVQLHLAARALADRDYPLALEHLERAEESPEPGTFERAVALRLFTLCHAGEPARAQALALERAGRLGGGPRIDDLFAWLGRECGVHPR